MNKKLSIFLLMLTASMTMAAHDFAVANGDGKTIYYNDVTAKNNKKSVEVTYQGTWYGAFKDSYVDTINIPTSIVVEGQTYAVVGIGEQAFSKNFKLTSVTIPTSIEYIGNKAFENCYSLAEVNYHAIRCADFTLPEFAPFSFGSMAYSEYVYPEDDKTFPDRFWSAYKLRTVNIGAEVERVPDYMFYGMGGGLQQVDYTRNPYKITYSKEGVTAINFLGVPKEIGNQSFRGCRVLRTIDIPAGVQSLGQALFADCDTLSSVTLPDDMKDTILEKLPSLPYGLIVENLPKLIDDPGIKEIDRIRRDNKAASEKKTRDTVKNRRTLLTDKEHRRLLDEARNEFILRRGILTIIASDGTVF